MTEHGRVRPTRDGLAAWGLTLALTTVALASGNNLLYLIVAPAWTLIGLAFALSAWNLRGLRVARILPPELYAGVEAAGRVVVTNRRRWMPAVAVDVHDANGAVGSVAWVAPGGEASAPVAWRFPRRGPARLDAVVLRSAFPFGFLQQVRRFERPAEVVVYPHPREGRARTIHHTEGGELAGGRFRGREGDFSGVRDYLPGDRPSAVHWRTTARLGRVVVVQGSGEVEPQVDVVVHDRADREGELERAAGELLDGFERGLRVGLVLPGFDGEPARRFPPSSGFAWRRTLLEALATVPEEPVVSGREGA